MKFMHSNIVVFDGISTRGKEEQLEVNQNSFERRVRTLRCGEICYSLELDLGVYIERERN